MKKYKIFKSIEFDQHASFCKAQNIDTGEIVMIKKINEKYDDFKSFCGNKELQCLFNLRDGNFTHENILEFKSVFRERNEYYFVLEYIERNLFDEFLSQKRSGCYFSEDRIRLTMLQIVRGLSHIHKKGYFHRDLKPESFKVKITNQGEWQIKISNFSVSTRIHSVPPLTEYVSTRWYRSPEQLLGFRNYTFSVDMFALGCVMAEMYMLRPLFPGKSEIDQLNKICCLLGTPKVDEWVEGLEKATLQGFKFPFFEKQYLSKYLRNASPDAIKLINDMLRWNPEHRPKSCSEILEYDYFKKHLQFPPSSNMEWEDGKVERMKEAKWEEKKRIRKLDYFHINSVRMREEELTKDRKERIEYLLEGMNYKEHAFTVRIIKNNLKICILKIWII